MIPRTRRTPPAIPARRGMLAPRFRGRVAVDGAPGVPREAPPPGGAGRATADPTDPGEAATVGVAEGTVPVARAAFGQRVF